MNELEKRSRSAKADRGAGGGEMGRLVRAYDWSRTGLGPRDSWPRSLLTTVDLCLASNFPIAIAWGPDGVQIYNDGYMPICGGKHPRSMGQSFRECWAEAWGVIGDAYEQALLGETSFLENQRIFLERNGYLEETFFSFSFSPIRDETGGIGGLFHPVVEMTGKMLSERRTRVLKDVADRTAKAKSADEACALAAQTLADHGTDVPFALLYLFEDKGRSARLVGVTGLDESGFGGLTYVDSTSSASLGWPQLEAVYRSGRAQELDDVESRFGKLVTAPYAEAPKSVLMLPITPPGAERPIGVLVAGVSARLALDEVYLGFYDLLTAAVTAAVANGRAFEEERRRAEALAEINLAKTAFFSNVSHEFRTPLTLMLGPLGDMLSRYHSRLDGEDRSDLEVIHRNGLRLLKLVNTLLDFSRIEAGRVQAVYEKTDIAALTADLASGFRSLIERAGMQLSVECSELSGAVYVDRDMWEKIVLNLLSNAFKYTLEGKITVKLSQSEGHFQLSVSDTGTGIPEDEIGHLFERFHRVEGARGRTHEGSGIGLAFVQELAKLHGGTVSVESVYGHGSTFTVRMPFGTAHLPKGLFGASQTLAPTSHGVAPFVEEASRWLPGSDGGVAHFTGSSLLASPAVAPGNVAATVGARIVLADDNADMRKYVGKLLEGQGWMVEAVGDGEAALRCVDAKRPDLVLTDVMMPLLDGFGLLAALKENPNTRAVPVVMLSARAGEESRVEGMRAGADDYLVKPFSAKELLARVNTHLQIGKLRAEAERQRASMYSVFMQAPVAIVVLDGPEHVFSLVNEHYYPILGPRRELIGKSVREALPDMAGQGFYELLDQVYASGEPYVAHAMPAKVALPGGGSKDLFVDFVYHPKRDFEGRIAGIIGVVIDVTAQVVSQTKIAESEKRLSAAVTELQEADRRKDEFLAVLSHELRSPLNVISGHAELLRMEEPGTNDFHESLDAIDRNTKVQTQLISDLLDISRIVTGKFLLDVSSFELTPVVNTAAEAVRFAAEAKGVVIDRRIQPGRLDFVGDATRIQQLVWNLLANSVKFTPKGGVVTLAVHRWDSRVEIVVSDTGQGIASDFLPHVFDRFNQEDASKTRKYGGLGLGLSIVRHVAELHGGTVSVESAGKDRGATFKIVLPIRALSPTEVREIGATSAAQASDDQVGNRPKKALLGLRALVVDDLQDSREMVSKVFDLLGAKVTQAASGRGALELLATTPFDVVICDIGMPAMNGLEFIKLWRRSERERCLRFTPALALTAYANEDDRLEALAAGFQSHLAKPFKVADLSRVTLELCGRGGTA